MWWAVALAAIAADTETERLHEALSLEQQGRDVDALTALQYAQIESSEQSGQLLKDHAQCYPSYDDEIVLEPLYPDRLGEDFIALTTPGHQNAAYPADPWTYGVLERLLSMSEDEHAPHPWALSVKTLLVEIGSRWPHIASVTWGGNLATGRHRRL